MVFRRSGGSGITLSPVCCCCWYLMLMLLLVVPSTLCTNYEKQSLQISYDKEDGLPTFGTLNGTVTELDTIAPNIALNKTDASLNCSSGYMNVALKFKQPFFGIVYADYDRNSACKVTGNGKVEETIELPLRGCGTLQSPARVFTNNIVVRFHPGLEIDGDEVITIVCRYPPPIVAPVPATPASIVQPEVVRTLQPLREFEILLIICAIIFLALLLLGMGCSYYCLKRRNIKVIRRRPTSTLGSEVTQLSEPISMFQKLKIPRAHAVDASGSEEATESVRTDFASDIASVESEEEYTSAYSDKLCVLAEGVVPAGLQEPPVPGFDVNMIVRTAAGAMTPVMSEVSSESSGTVFNAQEQYLTTILERTETNTLETLERIRNIKAKKAAGQVPVHARINIKNKELSEASGTDIDTMSEGTELYSEQELEIESRPMRNFSIIKEETEEERRMHRLREEEASRSSSRHYQERRDNVNMMSNFDVLIRIVNNVDDFRTAAATTSTGDDISSIFTNDERTVIRQVLRENTEIQTELKNTYSREELTVLRNNARIRERVSPAKWDVLIRVLQGPNPVFLGAVTEDESDSASAYSTDTAGTPGFRTMFTASSHHQHLDASSGLVERLSTADRSGTEIVETHHFEGTTTRQYEWRS